MENAIFLMAVLTDAPKIKERQESKKVQRKNYLRKSFLSSELSDVNDLATVVITKPTPDVAYQTWLKEVVTGVGVANEEMVYGADVEGKLVFVDLLRIGTDDDHKKKVIWLKKYQSLIDYTLTGQYTEDAHYIAHPEEVMNFFPKPDTSSVPPTVTANEITVQDLIDVVNARLVAKDPTTTATFANDRYDNYLEIYFNAGALAVETHAHFPAGHLLFSIPFIKSIVKTHQLQPGDSLVIGTATHKGKMFQYIWVKGTTSFYNYSNEPR